MRPPSTEEVVAVHDNMDERIQKDKERRMTTCNKIFEIEEALETDFITCAELNSEPCWNGHYGVVDDV